MGFWIKNNISKDKTRATSQYLYLRYSQYQRDKRTLKRKPRKLGEGTFDQNKYIKRKDIYLGKLIELPNPQKIFFFREYLENKEINNFQKYIHETNYKDLFNKYIEYMIEFYQIDKEELFSSDKHIVFDVAGAYISKRLIEWVNSFEFHQKRDPKDEKELDRFAARCEFIGIIDIEVISALYQKICPEIENEDIINALKEEIEEMNKLKLPSKEIDNLREFLENK